jgi:tetratricopeptide (TPR) repeat protein
MAQSASEAESLFNSKQYTKAKTMYEALLKRKPNDALNNYRLARCYYELNQYEDAVKYFERSGNRYTLKDLYLGEAYFHTYRFDLSVSAYQTFIATFPAIDTVSLEYI